MEKLTDTLRGQPTNDGVPMGDKYEKPRIRLWDNNFNLISDSHYCLRCGNVHPPGKCLRDNNDDGDDAA